MRTGVIERNNVRIFGQGKQVMMFAHGFGCDQQMWRFITPAFESAYKIVLFDYVGAGRSDTKAYNRERYASLEGYAKDILDICHELQLDNIIFVGHSVSCMTGMLAAIHEPRYFEKIIMVSPSPCYINKENYTGGFEQTDIEELLETMEKNYIGWAHFLAPNIMANADRPELAEELVESFCSTDPAIAQQFARATFLSDNRIDVEKCQIPVLILQCSDDMIAPREVGHFLSATLKNNSLQVMQAKGHCPHLSEPAETIRLMKAYLG